MKKLFLPLLLTFLILFSSCAHILPQIPPSGVETNTGITVTTDPSEGGDETSPDGGVNTPTAPPVGTVPDPEPPTAPAETSEGILDPEDPELPAEEDHTDENNDGADLA